ncbi:uncharacterized [Tachysurus ichikawai]
MITIRPGKGNGAVSKSRDSTKAQTPEGEHLRRAVNLLESGHSDEGRAVLKLVRVSLIGVRHDRRDDCSSLGVRCPLLLNKGAADFLHVIPDIPAFHLRWILPCQFSPAEPTCQVFYQRDLMESVHMNWLNVERFALYQRGAGG